MSPRWLHWPATATGTDWSDLADGVFQDASHTLNATRESIGTITSSVSYSDIDEVRVLSGGIELRNGGGFLTGGTEPPYIGIWTTFLGEASPEWRTYEWNGLAGFSARWTLISGNPGTSGDTSEPSVELAIIHLSASVLPTGWSNYS